MEINKRKGKSGQGDKKNKNKITQQPKAHVPVLTPLSSTLDTGYNFEQVQIPPELALEILRQQVKE